LQLIFSGEKDDGFARLKTAARVSEEDWRAFVTFAAAFYANFGNYKSFGDSKIIPAIPAEAFHKVLTASSSYAANKAVVDELWDAVRELLYSTEPVKELAFPTLGSSSYYSANASKEDAAAVQAFLDAQEISGHNTRLFKEADGSFVVRLVSAEESSTGAVAEGVVDKDQTPVKVVTGDYASLMGRVVAALEQAKAQAANPNQEAMLAHYCTSFRTGSIDAHMDGSRAWVQDKGPAVESYLGS
jgi:dipeptidyl-peptidase-3